MNNFFIQIIFYSTLFNRRMLQDYWNATRIFRPTSKMRPNVWNAPKMKIHQELGENSEFLKSTKNFQIMDRIFETRDSWLKSRMNLDETNWEVISHFFQYLREKLNLATILDPYLNNAKIVAQRFKFNVSTNIRLNILLVDVFINFFSKS